MSQWNSGVEVRLPLFLQLQHWLERHGGNLLQLGAYTSFSPVVSLQSCHCLIQKAVSRLFLLHPVLLCAVSARYEVLCMQMRSVPRKLDDVIHQAYVSMEIC